METKGILLPRIPSFQSKQPYTQAKDGSSTQTIMNERYSYTGCHDELNDIISFMKSTKSSMHKQRSLHIDNKDSIHRGNIDCNDKERISLFKLNSKELSTSRPKTSLSKEYSNIGILNSHANKSMISRPVTSQRIKHYEMKGKNTTDLLQRSKSFTYKQNAHDDIIHETKINCAEPKKSENIDLANMRRIAFQRVAQHKRSLRRKASIQRQTEEQRKKILRKERKEIALEKSRKRAKAYAINAVMKEAFHRHFAAFINEKQIENC